MATDTARYWNQLAKDWARAWAYGIDLAKDVAENQSPNLGPPARSEAGASTGVRRRRAGRQWTGNHSTSCGKRGAGQSGQ